MIVDLANAKLQIKVIVALASLARLMRRFMPIFAVVRLVEPSP
jgi:hypothetical protein